MFREEAPRRPPPGRSPSPCRRPRAIPLRARPEDGRIASGRVEMAGRGCRRRRARILRSSAVESMSCVRRNDVSVSSPALIKNRSVERATGRVRAARRHPLCGWRTGRSDPGLKREDPRRCDQRSRPAAPNRRSEYSVDHRRGSVATRRLCAATSRAAQPRRGWRRSGHGRSSRGLPPRRLARRSRRRCAASRHRLASADRASRS